MIKRHTIYGVPFKNKLCLILHLTNSVDLNILAIFIFFTLKCVIITALIKKEERRKTNGKKNNFKGK